MGSLKVQSMRSPFWSSCLMHPWVCRFVPDPRAHRPSHTKARLRRAFAIIAHTHCLNSLPCTAGGSTEGYCKLICAAAAAKGWRGAVLNYRGCAGVLPIVGPVLHMQHHEDKRTIVPTCCG